MDKQAFFFSEDTLKFFDEILGRVAIQANQPDFDIQAARISLARQELIAAFNQANDPTAPKMTFSPGEPGTSEPDKPEEPAQG